jgi:23S rRNA (guanosine2251-2'-O)-methyltransferase
LQIFYHTVKTSDLPNYKYVKKQQDNELIIGIRPIIEAISSGKSFVKIFFKKGLKGELFVECFNLARKNNIPFQYVPIEKLNRLTRANHQGVIAIVSPIPYQDISTLLPGIYESGKDPFLLVLDGITDIRNFGAIARSAEAAGIDAIIIGEKKAAMINSDAIKTSAGALNRIPVCRETELSKTIKFLNESGVRLFGASEKAEKQYSDADFKGPIAIIMGAEDTGISDAVIKDIPELIRIPMVGNISSLNVGVACGIIIFEALKQRISNSIK